MTNHINSKDEYVVNDAVVRGGLMVNGGKVVLEGSPWIKSNLAGGRSLYLYNNTVVDATGLIEGADVEIFDTAVSGEGRKIADVTTEQTWIKDAFRLSEDSTLAYVITREIDADGNVSLWLRPAIAAQVENATGIYDYQSLDAAIADCDSTETIILDLKGQEVTDLTIPGNLKLIDSTNDDYTTQTGSFTGTVSGTIYTLVDVDGKNYLVVANDGVYSAHRYSVEITHISLKPDADALGYKAKINGDAVVQAAVTGYGFNMGVGNGEMKAYNKATAPVNGEFTLRLQGIMAVNGGEMVIHAEAFVLFGAQTVKSSAQSTTMKQTIAAVNEIFDTLSDVQKAAVKSYVTANAAKMALWETDKITAWADTSVVA